MRVTIIGAGYVGLVTGACLAETGNTVMCVDKDVGKIALLKSGKIPFHEPGLAPLVEGNISRGRLIFSNDLRSAVRHAPVIFLAVGTPPRPNGEADLSAVEEAARVIGAHMDSHKVIVTKSTVPVGTAGRVTTLIAEKTTHPFAVVSNPEFLKEGAAVHDFMSPDRVILGGDDAEAITLLRALYAPFMRREDRILVMDAASAELTKYASNAMLATRISFMNEIAALCEKIGANAEHVRHGVGADSRIGSSFLFPGTGFGGSCFPKDLSISANAVVWTCARFEPRWRSIRRRKEFLCAGCRASLGNISTARSLRSGVSRSSPGLTICASRPRSMSSKGFSRAGPRYGPPIRWHSSVAVSCSAIVSCSTRIPTESLRAPTACCS
jgi:UDPglucose 6-dehydrogenase